MGFHFFFSESRPILLTTILALSSGCFVFDEYIEPGPCSWPDPSRNAKSCNNPIAIAAGGNHSCLIRANNTAWCWGANNRGQLGVFLRNGRQVVASHIPLEVPFPEDAAVTAIATGEDHTCAVNNGKLYCWGSNTYGQCGLSLNDTTEGDILQPLEVPGSNSNTWRAVTAGDRHTCAVDTENNVYCWGDNRLRQVDSTSGKDFIITPTQIALRDNIQSIHAGADFTCAEDSYDVICWGNARFGKTGREYDDVTQTFAGQDPYRVTTDYGKKIESLSTGSNHACVVYVSGQVYCWGSADNGRLGVKTQTSTVHIPGLVPVRATNVNNGRVHTCVLDNQGRVQCWGGNRNYQLGDGTEVDRFLPQPIAGAFDKVIQIAVGHEHACSLEENGRVQCWGLNEWGQSGQAWIEGSSESNRAVKQPSPITLPDPKNKEDNGLDGGVRVYPDAEANPDGTVLIPDSRDAGLASEDAGAMTNPDAGSVPRDAGMGDMDASMTADGGSGPNVLPTPQGSMLLATGRSHACIVRDNNTTPKPNDQQVFCWGEMFDRSEQNLYLSAQTITEVNIGHTTLSGKIIDIQAGNGFTCIQTEGAQGALAMDENGPSIYCWGKNDVNYMRPLREVDWHAEIKNETNQAPAYDIYDLKVDSQGATYVTGRFSGALNLGTNCGTLDSDGPNQSDGFLIKYASTLGQCEWAIQFQTIDSLNSPFVLDPERILALTLDDQDNVYVGGSIPSLAAKNSGSPNGISFLGAPGQAACPGAPFTARDEGNAFLVKYSSQGDCLWAGFFRGKDTVEPEEFSSVTDLAFDAANNRLWVMGYFNDSIRFDDTHSSTVTMISPHEKTNNAFSHAFLAALSTTSTSPQYVWSTVVAESSTFRNETGATLPYLRDNGLAVDESGNVWVGGRYTTEDLAGVNTINAQRNAAGGISANEVGLYVLRFTENTMMPNTFDPDAVFYRPFSISTQMGGQPIINDHADRGGISAIDVDHDGKAYAVGYVRNQIEFSPGNPIQPANENTSIGFVLRLNADNPNTPSPGILDWYKATTNSVNADFNHSVNDVVVDDEHERLFVVGEYNFDQPFLGSGGQSHMNGFYASLALNNKNLLEFQKVSGSSDELLSSVDLSEFKTTVKNSRNHRNIVVGGTFDIGPSVTSTHTIQFYNEKGSPYEFSATNSGVIMHIQQPTRGDKKPVKMNLTSAERTALYSMHVGDRHVCIRIEPAGGDNRPVWCWGYTGDGQITWNQDACTNKSFGCAYLTAAAPLDFQYDTYFNEISQVSTGFAHTCVLGTTMSGTQEIRCLGTNSPEAPSCGYDPTGAMIMEPEFATGALKVSGLQDRNLMLPSQAEQHTCVINGNNTTSCWGYYMSGAIYSNESMWPPSGLIGNNQPRFGLSQTSGLNNPYAKQVTTGADHTCVLSADNTVYCWGANGAGQLGQGSMVGGYLPIGQVIKGQTSQPLDNVRSVKAGGRFSCAIRANQTQEQVYCWGSNLNGQIGYIPFASDEYAAREVMLP